MSDIFDHEFDALEDERKRSDEHHKVSPDACKFCGALDLKRKPSSSRPSGWVLVERSSGRLHSCTAPVDQLRAFSKAQRSRSVGPRLSGYEDYEGD